MSDFTTKVLCGGKCFGDLLDFPYSDLAHNPASRILSGKRKSPGSRMWLCSIGIQNPHLWSHRRQVTPPQRVQFEWYVVLDFPKIRWTLLGVLTSQSLQSFGLISRAVAVREFLKQLILLNIALSWFDIDNMLESEIPWRRTLRDFDIFYEIHYTSRKGGIEN